MGRRVVEGWFSWLASRAIAVCCRLGKGCPSGAKAGDQRASANLRPLSLHAYRADTLIDMLNHSARILHAFVHIVGEAVDFNTGETNGF